MPALQTYVSPVKRRLTVSIPREYDGYSFEVIMIPVTQPARSYDGASVPRRSVRKRGAAEKNPLSQFVGCIGDGRRTDDVVRELRGYDQSKAAELWRLAKSRKKDPPKRVVADFLVGAHALECADCLLTRDHGFYRDYFKDLKVVDPTQS